MLLKVNGFYHLFFQVIPLKVTSIKVLVSWYVSFHTFLFAPIHKLSGPLSAAPRPNKNGSTLYTSGSQNVVQDPWGFPKTLSGGLQA